MTTETELEQQMDDKIQKMLDNNLQVQQLITDKKKETQTITYGPLTLKVKAIIDRKMRRTLVRAQTAITGKEGEEQVEVGEEQLYGLLANLCIDEPFTHPSAWRSIDDQTGKVPDIFWHVMNKLMETDDKIKKFR